MPSSSSGDQSESYTVARAAQTDAAVAEWEGVTGDNRGIFARYSGGELSVFLGDADSGPEIAEASGRLIFLKVVKLEEWKDSSMSYDGLKRHTSGFINWPDQLEDGGLGD